MWHMWEAIQQKFPWLLTVLQQKYGQNRLLDYLIFLALLLVGLALIKILDFFIVRRLVKRAEQNQRAALVDVMSICQSTLLPLAYFGLLYVSTRHLILPAILTQAINVLGMVLATVLAIRLLLRFVECLLQDKSVHETAGLLSQGAFTLFKVVIWSFGSIFLLDNLGFEVSAVITGLGIGGIAVALAAQTILKDLFNYFVILLDQPFAIGDFIVIDSLMGEVEHIGIKTTRIRSLSGEQLIIPNTDLTSARVRNYKHMERRRVAFKLNLTSQTTAEQLRQIPALIGDIIKNTAAAQLDRVHFAAYTDSGLEFEVVYFVLSGDYNKYMDIQQAINLAIKELSEQRKLEFAYPTSTVFMK